MDNPLYYSFNLTSFEFPSFGRIFDDSFSCHPNYLLEPFPNNLIETFKLHLNRNRAGIIGFQFYRFGKVSNGTVILAFVVVS